LGDLSAGFGLGDQLRQQTLQETEEQRRQRLLELQRQSTAVPLSNAVGGLGSVSRSFSAGLLSR
jgi:hypothetical protein